jgi:hypothetical protein
MKKYSYFTIVILLIFTHPTHAFWSNIANSLYTKINNITDVIIHKEFDQAKRLELSNENGTIIVNSWQQNTIAIEVIISSTENFHKEIKVDMESLHGVIKVHTIFSEPKIKGSVDFNILLPKNVDLHILTKQGDIIVKDVDSTLKLETLDGDIKVTNPHNSMKARTEYGNIFVRTDAISKNHEFHLTSDKGNIEMYIMETLNTTLQAQAPQGKITSDIFITLDSQTTLLNQEAWKMFKQSVQGTIGESESKLHITAYNGSIAFLPYMKQNDIF